MKKILILFIAIFLSGCTANRDFILQEANESFLKGDYDRALLLYDKAIKRYPRFAPAYNSRGMLYEKFGETEKAVKDYKRATRVDRNYFPAYTNWGAILLDLGQYKQAAEILKIAVEIKPDDALSLTNLGSAYYELGDFKKAKQNFERAVKLDPRSYLAYYNRAVYLLSIENSTSAVEDLNKAVKINTRFVTAYFALGKYYFGIENYKKALENFEEVTILDLEHGPAHYYSAICKLKTGDERGALPDISTAVQLMPMHARSHEMKGDLIAQINPDLAKESYKIAKMIDPKNSQRYDKKIENLEKEKSAI